MSNTYSTIAQSLAVEAASAISTLLCPFASVARAFPLEKGGDPALPRVVSIVKSVSATQTSANPDYTVGDATIAPAGINHTLFTQPFGIGNDELNNGARLAWLYNMNGQKLAASISDALTSLLTTANFGAALVTSPSASFTINEFESLYCGVQTSGRAIVLDSPYFVKVKPASWCPQGFTNVLEHTRWSAAGANVRGFVADPAAIVLSYAMPTLASPHRNVVAEAPFTLPQIGGLEGAATVYFVPDTRRLMGCLSIYMGATVGDSNALKLLTSA